VEAIGEWPFRARAKRRKASMVGEAAGSAEALFPSVPWAYWRRDGHASFLVLPSEVCWVPRKR
jgi:hypothetical protein